MKSIKKQRYFEEETVKDDHSSETNANQKKKSSVSQDVQIFSPKMKRKEKHRPTKQRKDWEAPGRISGVAQQMEDPYPGPAPVDKEVVQKHSRRKDDVNKSLKTKFHGQIFKKETSKQKWASKQAARAELLVHETAGYLEADEGEETTDFSQTEIAGAIDITSAQKYFELKLDKFGPYRVNYTRNGRHMLIGGRKGHVAAFDWQTKDLMCEMNVMETCNDIKWFHNELMFAVAQKRWLYVYDKLGIELHCLKSVDRTLRLEFLPYHFLLVSGNESGFLQYIDVSIGKSISSTPTKLGRLDVMCQNPRNAIIHLGHTGGTVTLWSPNVKEPLVKMLAHKAGVRSVAVHHSGNYMATSSIDATLKLWDLRNYQPIQMCKLPLGASDLSFSQRGLLAAGLRNVVQVYRDSYSGQTLNPYVTHKIASTAHSVEFCPYEDVLGVGHSAGFSSLIIPGAGEPNFDALEANPYQNTKQRQESEIKMLLDKIQPEMITLDSSVLGQVDKASMEEKMEEKLKSMFFRPKKSDFTPKESKSKGRNKPGRIQGRKQNVRFQRQQDEVRHHRREQKQEVTDTSHKRTKPYNMFDRFKKSSV